MCNRENLRDQNKSNFSQGAKPILLKQLRDQKCNLTKAKRLENLASPKI